MRMREHERVESRKLCCKRGGGGEGIDVGSAVVKVIYVCGLMVSMGTTGRRRGRRYRK